MLYRTAQGLLANSHRGILYVDDVNLLDMDLVTMMLQVTDCTPLHCTALEWGGLSEHKV